MAFWAKKDELKQSVVQPASAKPIAPQAASVAVSNLSDPSTTVTSAGKSSAHEDGQASFALPAGKLRTAIGVGTSISGKLSFDTPVQINGCVRGEIFSSKSLTLGTSAVVEGTIVAPEIVVLGQVSGTLQAGERIELKAGAKVSGTVLTSRMLLEEGAQLDACVAPNADAAARILSGLSSSIEASSYSRRDPIKSTVVRPSPEQMPQDAQLH